jgi:hypothetical protein
VVVCNIPRFYQILGEFFFAFVMLEMVGNSQGFKTFRAYLKALLENYFKLSIIFLKNFFEKDQVSKYYFFIFSFLLFKPMQATCKGYLLK